MSIASLHFIGSNYSNNFFINDLDGAINFTAAGINNEQIRKNEP